MLLAPCRQVARAVAAETLRVPGWVTVAEPCWSCVVNDRGVHDVADAVAVVAAAEDDREPDEDSVTLREQETQGKTSRNGSYGEESQRERGSWASLRD